MNIGFNDTDLSNIWDDVLEIEDDEFDIDKELTNIIPKTRNGDIWQLGSNRLICGDSTKPETLEKLLGKNKLDVLYTDPPFNIGLDYNKGIGNKSGYGGKITKDNKSSIQYKEFLKKSSY